MNIFIDRIQQKLRAHRPRQLWKWRLFRLFVLLNLDALLLISSYYLAFVLRLDSLWHDYYGPIFLKSVPLLLAIALPAFYLGGMYRQVWRFANYNSAILIARCVVLAISTYLIVVYAFRMDLAPSRSVFGIFGIICFVVILSSRFGWRTWSNYIDAVASKKGEELRCIIYGAGQGGDIISRHIATNRNFGLKPVAFIDDDPNKKGRLVHGLRIVGTGKDLTRACMNFDVQVVLLAIPSAPGQLVRKLVQLCKMHNLKLLIMPDLRTTFSESYQPRSVEVRDLLRRAPKPIDREFVNNSFAGKTVLITGAGGSIGSELSRQVAAAKPSRIVAFDSCEYNLYEIENQLRSQVDASIEIFPVLGSVSSSRLVSEVFTKFQPQIVLHAAAYKHVPLLESNAVEGILNNVVGTQLLIDASNKFACEQFVLISSDKAVRPTNVMGATKRVCELMVLSMQKSNSKTRYCAVRFGNVLGSSGSVIPRFLQQIKAGGPVTVTHPEMTRYFMLIDEAVGLVLQAAAMSKGGEVFVLNMGEPVKISDMAMQLIILAGKDPGHDIEIQYTGLRPGEKLYEELILEGAEILTTHDDIFVARPADLDEQGILADTLKLLSAASQGNEEKAISILKIMAGMKTSQESGKIAVAENKDALHSVH